MQLEYEPKQANFFFTPHVPCAIQKRVVEAGVSSEFHQVGTGKYAEVMAIPHCNVPFLRSTSERLEHFTVNCLPIAALHCSTSKKKQPLT